MDQYVITSPDKESTVVTDHGELVGYSHFGEELIHQKGDRGWRNSDTEMFPVIGPTSANDFKVITSRGYALQDQHGLLREMDYKVIEVKDDEITFEKVYKKGTHLKNSKYPDKSSIETVFWPYDFTFRKKLKITDHSLDIRFEIEAEEGMPYMLGYHPAFRLSGQNTECIEYGKDQIRLQDVLDVGSVAYQVKDTDYIRLVKQEGQSLDLRTKGFGNFMLWTEVPNMICIEPITSYPYTGKKELGKELFTHAKKGETAYFEVIIKPIKA
ncbi:aldose 1-epimerase [Lutimonas zeaxanthinifaciens]|uniref:aldose epimerase family protein n=1 Tax=Lutimonas zeaxanthinifaciens TaxID=3060215 RepID=UPI00265D1004|nr:aldose 1-epimerase [Lutimonas sp. YSD2104]WKK67549.1 aldose 1-epimerase [Lutimonas sp. YSD2104]